MNENELIAIELETEMQAEAQQRNAPRKVSNRQVREARFIWMAGTVAIDILTAYIVYKMTFWYYGVIWILAGAGGLLWAERLKERIGNNVEQADIARRGVNVSAIAVFAMALGAGAVWVLQLEVSNIEAVMELAALGLFFFHLYQSYTFHDIDDEIIAANDEALAEERTRQELNAAHRAARKVSSKRVQHGVANSYRQRYGKAFDVAYNKTVDAPELANPTSRQDQS